LPLKLSVEISSSKSGKTEEEEQLPGTKGGDPEREKVHSRVARVLKGKKNAVKRRQTGERKTGGGLTGEKLQGGAQEYYLIP